MSRPEAIFEKQVYSLYRRGNPNITEFTPFATTVEEQVNAAFRDSDIDYLGPNFWYLLFFKTDLTKHIQLAAARTTASLIKAIIKQDPSLVTEVLFAVRFGNKRGVHTTYAPSIPAAYDIQRHVIAPEIGQDEVTLGFVHTHPVFPTGDTLIKPSVYIETDERIVGDLASFIFLRQDRGIHSQDHTIDRPFVLIIQQNIDPALPIQLLLIRESVQLTTLDAPTYLQRLKDYAPQIDSANNQASVNSLLSEIGFRFGILEIPLGIFYDYPPIDNPDKLTDLARDTD